MRFSIKRMKHEKRFYKLSTNNLKQVCAPTFAGFVDIDHLSIGSPFLNNPRATVARCECLPCVEQADLSVLYEPSRPFKIFYWSFPGALAMTVGLTRYLRLTSSKDAALAKSA